MDLDNLKSNMIVKNYKEMCDILGEVPKEGKGRQLQLKEWQRYFGYTKKGHQFVIEEVYATPLPKDFSKDDVYSKYVQVVLSKHLKETGCGEFTMKSLLQTCGFVNKYWDDMELLGEYAKKNDITYGQAQYYYNQLYQHVYTYCNQAITRCLNRLSQRGFLRWNKVLFIVEEDKKEPREATTEEVKEYLNIECQVRASLGIKYVNTYNRNDYYNEVSKKINEELGWVNAYNMIRIIYATDFIDKIIEESEEEYKQSLLSVNEHNLNQMYKYIDTDIEKDVKKLADKTNEDIEIARLCYDVDRKKREKTELTDMYVKIG